ncbi:hypothetical protein Deipe_4049 (plasmid) [Deinococcus peraridilitoris DSM 19664]|uniref:Uncharacterized protein n=1 Tax=Deinococcus peraridilitoris (strain DSM 19664 / LMG 22246 / CIP 109416 / KR-200) TaxID=937777 RepID=L0A6G0_DEIPD|nr:hypothetical protein Deipe_4049 [Deinococcus peraridilitoris DSM 19664]
MCPPYRIRIGVHWFELDDLGRVIRSCVEDLPRSMLRRAPRSSFEAALDLG